MGRLLCFVLATGLALAQNTTSMPSGVQSIEMLRQKIYGQGEIEVVRTLSQNRDFTRYLVRWPSDGLTQYGFVNVPAGPGPFAVVAVLHGYVEPSRYNTLTYTTRYADAITRMGYVVLHPNYRGHPPSQGTPDGPYRIGYAVDVMHLLALVRKQSGRGFLTKADATRVGLWGHSMGGGIALRIVAVDPNIRAAVLYGSMSGNERQNARQIYEVFSNRQRGLRELQAPEEEIRLVSPIFHLQASRTAFSVHHGTQDEQVPYAWSVELCKFLKAQGKAVQCLAYNGAPHTFSRGSAADTAFLRNVQRFLQQYLR